MADSLEGGADGHHPKLNLTADEKRLYGQLFRTADPDGFGAVSGDVAVTFFDRTKLASDVLGQIWQIADRENRGLLTPSGFSVVLRLIGHAQAGRVPTPDLASQPGPLPRFDGLPQAAPRVAPQNTGPSTSPTQAVPPPIRVPALSPEKVNEYSALFEKSGAENGLLPGIVAKQIFERAKLPNEVLGRIWNLADTQGRGALDRTEFAIAMHLLASYKSGTMRGVPQTLPAGLYEAAAKRVPVRMSSGSSTGAAVPSVPPIPPQFTGLSVGRPQSPLARQQARTPLSAQSTGDGWAVSAADKVRFDQIFTGLDKLHRGFITGDQAVDFFGNASLPEEVLAQIWDLADINSEGQLNRDEFAVAMYLIRQQRGTKEGRGNLPAALPPSLIPPMMRKHQAPPSHPTAPAFEKVTVTKPTSAADDLFGLDAFSSAPSQAPQSTGDSTAGGPFQNPTSPLPPPSTSSPGPSTTFKPFVPSSSFGQSLAPQQTGLSPLSQRRAIQPSDDLLGDADPEVSQKLTAETSELANLSNQVGNLSQQMQEVQATRASSEEEISHGSQQKKEFELRLSQLRTMYEREVKDLKVLQEQLSTQRNDLKRLRQDVAMLEGGLQDVQSQRQQLSATLEAEMRDKAFLTEKLKMGNNEMLELKPQVEKLKSELRQQKGLVAISKKQLATLDTERDRLRDEFDSATADLEVARKEAEEQARSASQTPSVASPAAMASPASVGSAAAAGVSTTNPFFRRGTGTSDLVFAPPIPSREQKVDRESAFESMFGPSFASPIDGAPGPPSFKNGSSVTQEGSATQVATSESQLGPSSDVLSSDGEPPAPPKSRQITSAALPFRAPLDRAESVSSSVKVAPPASRLSPAITSRAATPTGSASSDLSQSGRSPDLVGEGVSSPENGKSSPSPYADHPTPIIPVIQGPIANERFGKQDSSQDIPGAFPEFETPRSEFPPAAAVAGIGAAGLAAGGAAAVSSPPDTGKDRESEKQSSNLETNFDQYFGGPAHNRSPSQKAADFDSAFANFKQPTTNGTASTSMNEFPPIRELDGDDSDDSSDAPAGFEDNFTPASPRPPVNGTGPEEQRTEVRSAVPTMLQARPLFNTVPSTNSSLPEIEAQKSPPTYGESVPRDNPDHFPPEFQGLLPHRGDPTSPEQGLPRAVEAEAGAPAGHSLSQPYAPQAAKAAPVAEASPAPSAVGPQQRKLTENDFDAAFADMTTAPVVEDDDDDDFDTTFANNHSTDFDPTFDSPAPSKSTTATASLPIGFSSHSMTTTADLPANKDMTATNDFYNFSSNVHESQSWTAQAAPPAPTAITTTNLKDSEWDDLFSGLDKPAAPPTDHAFPPPQGPPPPSSSVAAAVFSDPTTINTTTTNNNNNTSSSSSAPPPPWKQDDNSNNNNNKEAERPVPGRALTMGTEHDDPILKRLTSMGWSREESLQALEEFDYNIDKAVDHLTFKS